MSNMFVRAPAPERALTPAQRRALLAMRSGAEADAASIAEAAGMKPNGVGLALRALERRGLVTRQGDGTPLWTVTFAGRALAQRLGENGDAPKS
jgi:DNA-binding MarR family transcriptional regulator